MAPHVGQRARSEGAEASGTVTEADFFDYEPSRLRLADMNPLERIAATATPFITLRRRPHRSIASARERLQSGHGLGMVMLCALGQMHEARA